MGTNKKRKRAPGGGRKPEGRFAGNTERISVRCTPEIKDRLEIAAKKNERSLPQEIQERLQRTFDDETDRGRDSPTWALLWMVEYAALQFRGRDKDEPAWRTNPAEFEGLKRAIDRILARLRPEGDAAESLVRTAAEPNSPLARAERVEWLIFDSVGLNARPEQITAHYRKGRRGELPNFPLESETARLHNEFMEREEGRSNALKAFGLK
jgi:hypothetical protein